MTPSPVRYRFGPFSYEPHELRLCRDDAELPLQARAHAVLAALLARPGSLVPREELMEAAWPGLFVTDNSLGQCVRRIRKVLDDDPRAPTWVETVVGRGYRFLGDVQQHDASEPGPEVPTPRPALLGRSAELQALSGLLDEHRLVTVLGPGGVGKTTLVRHLINSRPPASTLFCDLSAAQERRAVVAALAGALQLGPGERAVHDLQPLCDALDNDTRLVVFDDCEGAIEAVAAIAKELLDNVADLRLLVTSRERLRLSPERCLELGPLAPEQAVALLRERARAARAETADLDDDLARRIVDGVDRLPLGIELAAPALLILDPGDLAQRLGVATGWLSDQGRDRTVRQASLAATVAWSWQLLSPRLQQACALLAVFQGPFELAAAEAVLDTPDAHLLVASLRDASLLRPVPGQGRWLALYGAVREHAVKELVRSDDGHSARVRMARHLASRVLVDETAGRLPTLGAAAEDLWSLWRNLTEAGQRLDIAEALDAGLRRGPEAGALGPVLDQAVALARSESPDRLAAVLTRRAAWREEVCRDHPGALDDVEEVLALPGADRAVQARAMLVGGIAHLLAGRADVAEATWKEVLPEAHALGLPLLAARAEGALGVAALRTSRPEQAQHHLGRAATVARAHGANGVLANVRYNQAVALRQLGRRDEEREALTEVSRTAGPGDMVRAAMARADLALLDLEAGQLEAAEAQARSALDLVPHLTGRTKELAAVLGDVLLVRGDLAGARTCFDRYAALGATSPSPFGLAEAAQTRALLAICEGHAEDAVPLLADVQARFLALEHPAGAQEAAALCAVALALVGRETEARHALDRADGTGTAQLRALAEEILSGRVAPASAGRIPFAERAIRRMLCGEAAGPPGGEDPAFDQG